jgi:hypothetical protein
VEDKRRMNNGVGQSKQDERQIGTTDELSMKTRNIEHAEGFMAPLEYR